MKNNTSRPNGISERKILKRGKDAFEGHQNKENFISGTLV